MNTLVGIAIYDPRRLDRDSFLAGFVARGDFVEFLLDKLRHMLDVAEHHIVVGQRGMGKTSLLRRLAIGIASEPALRDRYIPLTFREEQYNVRSLDVFWRNCGEALAEWCESEGKKDVASDIDRSLLTPVWRDSRSAVEAFLGAAKKLGGRPVLFVDNLDLILDALTPEQNWELRRTLQAPGGPILFGAATQMLRQSADQTAAFYEFFHPHVLEPLSEGELLQCMSRLADARGEAGKPVREILVAEPERIRTLHTLTGGNPRVLTLVYQLLERTESDTVFSDLEVLLDQLTPFYKARIEEYQTDLQRAIIDAIALNWHPITSHDLGEATAVEVTTVSAQLNRLKRDGLVEEVQTSGARSGYQLVERFFNIWYLMRHGTRRTRQKIYWLTAFLTSFYAPAELIRMRSESAGEGQSSLHPFYREALEAIGDLWTDARQMEKAAPLNSISEKAQGANVNDESSGASSGNESEIHSLFEEALAFDSTGRREEAIRIYDKIVSQFGDAEEAALRMQAAGALFNKGVTLGLLGRSEEEILVYDEIVNRFGIAEEAAFRERVAEALFNKGVTLSLFGRSKEEISAYDEIVGRFEMAEDLSLREQVASALVNKGYRLGSLGRSDEAIAVYDDVVSRFGTAEEPALRERVARASVNKGFRLGSLGRSDEAIAVYDDVVNRFGTAEEPALREQVARALVNKGFRLGLLERSEEAIAVYDDVVNRFGAAEEAPVREQVARALVNKGFRLGLLGRSDEAIAVYDDVVNRFGTAEEAPVRERVVRALSNKGFRLGSLGRNEEALKVYDDIVSRFGTAEEPALREQVARVLFNKGLMLGSLGRSEEAITVCDDIVSRFGAAEEPALREQVVGALANKAIRLDSLDRREEAIAVYGEIISRYGTAKEPDIRRIVLVVLKSVAATQNSQGRTEEAEAASRRAVEIDPGDYDAWVLLGNILSDRSAYSSEAEAAYRSAISISDNGLIAEANLAWLLLSAGRIEEAATIRASLDGLHSVGLALLDAAFEMNADNWGAATTLLNEALTGDQEQLNTTFSDDLLRLLRIAEARDFGEKLITWFVESGQAEQRAPIYAAFVAYVRGEKFLLDFSPEVRKPAERILRWLTSHRKDKQAEAPTSQPKRRRGRPPRKRT